MVRLPNNKKKERSPKNSNGLAAKIKKSSSTKLISSNKEKILLKKYNLNIDKQNFRKIPKIEIKKIDKLNKVNKANKTNKNNQPKKVCDKFKKNPQLFYTEDLCNLVIKSLDLEENEDNKENDKILVNKINQKDKENNTVKYINRNNIFLNNENMEEMNENIEPFYHLQKIIEESDEDIEKNK